MFHLSKISSVTICRHSQYLTNVSITKEEILSLFRGEVGKWMVINGEYLNKSKQDENRLTFNHKFVIFDILVYNSEYLVGETFQDRINLLDELYGQNDSEKPYLYSISDTEFFIQDRISSSDISPASFASCGYILPYS